MIGVFNRSHYEDVLVVRVHGLVPPEVWKPRYEQINAFERHLVANGVTILKFCLHISAEEQRQRLIARLRDPSKHWKFNAGDLKERALWQDYTEAYADAIEATGTAAAPWYVVPADRKWYRNWAVANLLLAHLDDLDLTYPEVDLPVDELRARIATTVAASRPEPA